MLVYNKEYYILINFNTTNICYCNSLQQFYFQKFLDPNRKSENFLITNYS